MERRINNELFEVKTGECRGNGGGGKLRLTNVPPEAGEGETPTIQRLTDFKTLTSSFSFSTNPNCLAMPLMIGVEIKTRFRKYQKKFNYVSFKINISMDLSFQPVRSLVRCFIGIFPSSSHILYISIGRQSVCSIDHFRVALNLITKARLRAKFLL